MDEKMRQALLECCERNCEVLSPDVFAFIKDLVTTTVTASDNKLDDAMLPLINMALSILEEFVNKQIDKIDGKEG